MTGHRGRPPVAGAATAQWRQLQGMQLTTRECAPDECRRSVRKAISVGPPGTSRDREKRSR